MEREKQFNNLKNISKDFVNSNPILKDAIDTKEEKEKEIEKSLKDTQKEIGITDKELENGFTGNTGKKVVSSSFKKMHLSESLFEEAAQDDEEIKDKQKKLKERENNINQLVKEKRLSQEDADKLLCKDIPSKDVKSDVKNKVNSFTSKVTKDIEDAPTKALHTAFSGLNTKYFG